MLQNVCVHSPQGQHAFFGTNNYFHLRPYVAKESFEKPFLADVTVINVLMRHIESSYYTFTLL